MTEATITAADERPSIDLAHAPLELHRDQREQWVDYEAQPLDFDKAANRIIEAHERDGEREDLGVGDLSTWAFGPTNDGHAAIAPRPAPGREQRLVPLREHGFSQLCSRVGAPPRYIRKLPAKLQMACLNWGMSRAEGKDKAATLRLAGGQARAVVSDRYAALDDALVLEIVRQTLQAAGMLGDVRVRAVATGVTTAMRLTVPTGSDTLKRKEGDVVECGLDLLNGEVGNRSISLTPILWRLICLNGMRRGERRLDEQLRLRHIGSSERLEEAFRDALPVALQSSSEMRQRMDKAVDQLLDDVLSEFDGLRSFGLNAGEARNVGREVMAQREIALPEDHSKWADAIAEAKVEDVSVFDVANAITRTAQSHGTDRRLEMEEVGAKYLYKRT